MAPDTQGAASWRFFLSPDQSFRSQRYGMGSGLVAWLPVDLEKCACVLFHSSTVHGWDGKLSPIPSFQPSATLSIPHTGRLWKTFDISLFSSQTRMFPVLLCPPLPMRIPSFPALLTVFHQGTLFPSDISFNFVRSIECNSGRLVFH